MTAATRTSGLRKYVFENVEEILKPNFRKILRRAIMRKFGTKFYPNFGNNLKEKGLKSFEENYIFLEILRKFQGNVRKISKRKILKKIFLHCENGLRK